MISGTDSNIFTLHRYFIWCNKMRTDFDNLLNVRINKASEVLTDELIIYMSYWYAGLYVVIEGWNDLKLHDDIIDGLLLSKNVDLLRRYRNGAFHFQKEYYDDRFLGFMREGENCIKWVRELNRQFGRFFLEFLKKHNGE